MNCITLRFEVPLQSMLSKRLTRGWLSGGLLVQGRILIVLIELCHIQSRLVVLSYFTQAHAAISQSNVITLDLAVTMLTASAQGHTGWMG